MMKMRSETAGLEKLGRLRDEFRKKIVLQYERRAKPCSLCNSPGECCRDEHFVNVRISRLEAVAIEREIEKLPRWLVNRVSKRTEAAIDKLDRPENEDHTFACPLYEDGIGCLVHKTAKPFPCIHHGCYESREDLPPDQLLEQAEITVGRLNRQVYGRIAAPIPIPVAISSSKD